jgi:tRNA 5-methylaminomethyl-2-thiouridine biosynthesis bifunctional protein
VTFRNGDVEETEAVVLCSAHEISKLAPTSWVPLEAIRGQTVQARTSLASVPLRTVISYDGYITPEYDGVHFIGAHYRHNDMSEEPDQGDTSEILSRLYRTLPSISNLAVSSSRVCFRASTHDRMPYIGALPLRDAPQLFINAGHGSRGLLTAPLGGEIIARLVHNEPLEDLEEAATIASAARLTKRYQAST